MNAGQAAKAAQAYSSWVQSLDQLKSAITGLEGAMNRSESLYQIVRDNADAVTQASYGEDAAAEMGPIIANGAPKVKAFVEWVAAASGMTVEQLMGLE